MADQPSMQSNSNITIDHLVDKYVLGGKDAVAQALKDSNAQAADNLTFNDLKMDSLDVVQLAVKVQDDLGIKLSDDEFAKVPQETNGQGQIVYKPADKVTLGDIAGIINKKLQQK